MTKIYLAENFLEADQIISELEANHIFAKKGVTDVQKCAVSL